MPPFLAQVVTPTAFEAGSVTVSQPSPKFRAALGTGSKFFSTWLVPISLTDASVSRLPPVYEPERMSIVPSLVRSAGVEYMPPEASELAHSCGSGVVVAGSATPTGLTVGMCDISDTFMTLAAVAPFASSPVTITGIANVRLKESDRIAAMESNLRRLGVKTASGPDFLRVYPGTPSGGRIDPHDDHRIAMSFAVLGLRARGVVIEDPGCVSKTCPDFFELWKALEQGTA